MYVKKSGTHYLRKLFLNRAPLHTHYPDSLVLALPIPRNEVMLYGRHLLLRILLR